MVSDALLSELERQEKYLAQLPEDYEFPLFNARQAVESQRRSGYKDTAAASREVVDNAIEACATRVDVVFDTVKTKNGKRLVSAVAFIDNGAGMGPEMARFALSWGGGTHFEDPQFIGRFGFGLPNSSINQTRRVEVYTRTASDQPFTRAYLDINSPSAYGMQFVPPEEQAPLPGFVRQYIDRNKLAIDHGTVVVWVDPDRLTYRSPAYLRDHLIDDFGQRHQEKASKRKAGDDATPGGSESPTPAEQAADTADVAHGKRPRVPERHIPEARDTAEQEAQQRAPREGTSVEEALDALEREARRRRSRVSYHDQEHGPFYEPAWRGSQLEVKVNRRHPFYEVFYTDRLRLPGGARAKAALDLVLLALARTENDGGVRGRRHGTVVLGSAQTPVEPLPGHGASQSGPAPRQR